MSAAVEIAAPAERVYELVSEVTGQHRFTAECSGSQWLGGATGPSVGARFRGSNRHGGRRWSTTARVLHAEPGRRFGYLVSSLGMALAEWEYLIEPTGSGCRVEERTVDRRNALFRAVIGPLATGVRDRAAHNRRNIVETLRKLKELAEQS
ncbi:SRPBCC family protein [Kutzneria viridogrisea]|uniref:Polyketide cyclase/dehydrase n=2 Tax=Kutzneria TaxID=43356 RepID=W5VZV2_9PSEU|nr:SRPBCC family protein [Kutzneria albida]AHH94030.1 hypothetical protein KALB_655 [Kutzneria albida DSM 43870]MBA8930964.1 uncharacterized protein YndB with AHSA1/START domain [Kutzneria viridogrisea]